jgi:hypothetical protein
MCVYVCMYIKARTSSPSKTQVFGIHRIGAMSFYDCFDTYIYTYIHTYTHASCECIALTHMSFLSLLNTCMHACIYIHTYVQSPALLQHACMHTYICIYIHTYRPLPSCNTQRIAVQGISSVQGLQSHRYTKTSLLL